MRELAYGRDVDNCADRMRSHRAGDKTGVGIEQRFEIFGVQRAVGAHPPPDDLGAVGLQRQPGGDVGVVIHVGDDDFVALAEHLGDAEAHQPDEGGGIEPEGNFLRPVGIDEQADAFARLLEIAVDPLAVLVFRHALDIEIDEMIGDCVDDALRHLRAAGIFKENEIAGLADGGEHGPDLIDRKVIPPWIRRCRRSAHIHSLSLPFRQRDRSFSALVWSRLII